jgi:hypothetical protein
MNKSQAVLPDFSWYSITKMGKIYQKNTYKIYQILIKYTKPKCRLQFKYIHTHMPTYIYTYVHIAPSSEDNVIQFVRWTKAFHISDEWPASAESTRIDLIKSISSLLWDEHRFSVANLIGWDDVEKFYST